MIIGVESSCDESAIAVFDQQNGIILNEISSQISIHSEYGGVVPEIAAREHLKAFPIIIKSLINSINLHEIDYIAVTNGPGLAGCLSLGISVARTLSLYCKKPLIPINHLKGHILSPFLSKIFSPNGSKDIKYIHNFLPHLGLLVSGGNTNLLIIDKNLRIKILGKTVDDAAGEAFDKGAKLLGMPYPGGKLIEKFALTGNKDCYKFPCAFSETREIKFSFSGLKTSLRYFLEKLSTNDFENSLPDICASYQHAIVSALAKKIIQALSQNTGIKSIGLSGGVSNNKSLRAAVELIAKNNNLEFIAPEPIYTGDNAAMIAFAAYCELFFETNQINKNFTAEPNLDLK